MKKILYIFIVSFLVLSVAGCKKTKTPTPVITPTPEVSETITPEISYKYNDFSGSEKNKLINFINDTIPFIPNNEYYFELENGIITYKIVGNDESDLRKFSDGMSALGYTYVGWAESSGHTFTKGNILVGCGTKVENDVLVIYVFVTLTDFDYPTVDTPTQGGDEPTTDVPTQGGDEPTTDVPTQGGEELPDQELTLVENPEVNKAYKLSFYSTAKSTSYYFIGTMQDYYGATSTNPAEGVDMKLETVTGGYSLYFLNSSNTKQYINIETSGTHINFVFRNTASTVWTWDSSLKALVGVHNGATYFMGTYENYTTYGMSAIDKAPTSYVAQLFIYNPNASGGTTPTPDQPTVPDEPTDTPVESSIQKILDEAANLSANATLSGNRTAYGYVKEITEAYTSQYKTISFILSDGTAEILVHRTKSSCASSLKVGDYVTVIGTIINFKNDKVQVIEFQYPEVTLDSNSSDQGGSGDTGGDSSSSGSTTHTHTDFTTNEKTLFNNVLGLTIPFIPNDEYSVEEFSDETGTGINFYSFGNTQAEFNDYLTKIENAGFISDGTGTDEYGDTWYYYSKGELYLDVSYYEYEGDKVVDLYIYFSEESDSGNTGGSTGDSGSTSNVDLITNDGKGLPTGTNGVYNVNFNDATYVKNVADQGYYQGGCPTTGDVKVLVIPVEFSDVTASSKGYDLSKLDLAFNGSTGSTDYYSVKEYYNISSYGQLDLDFVILDSWFRPANNSTHYLNATMDYYGSDITIGDQMIMNEALAYLDSSMDLSEFDSDNNGMIDAVIMINTLDIDSNVDMQWAYRYWNLYTDSDENSYEYDQVSANDYLWASYKFLLESYEDSSSYSDDNMNTYTYIHEFGHVLGSDDYYDYAEINEPLSGCDIMDYMLGDHNPYTKFNYGWLTTSRLVVGDSTVTLTLEDFSVNGDTIIIADNWDSTLGAYQEYYVLMYYKNIGLNGNDYGYFANDGIVVYHVNASLYKEEQDDEVYYDVYNNNTDASDESGTVDNLIELVKSSNDTFIHGEGVSSISTLAYTFTVDSLSETSASITFTKN